MSLSAISIFLTNVQHNPKHFYPEGSLVKFKWLCNLHVILCNFYIAILVR